MVSTGDLHAPFRPHPAGRTAAEPPPPAGAAPPREDAERPANSLFQQPWWLDAVAPGSWDEASVVHDGRTVARLPFVVRGRGRMRVLAQPPLTATLGPWIDRPDRPSEARVAAAQLELMTELVAALPPAAAFRQSFSPTVMHALPFHWAGYRLGVRYTYRLEGLGTEDGTEDDAENQLWTGLSPNVRGHVRRSRKVVEIRDDLGLDRFCAVWAKTYERQGLRPPDMRVLERVESACAPRGARLMLFAVDESDRIHAVSYVVWDRHGAYYVIGGGDPQLRGSGAQSLLMWESILRSRAVTDVFDFEGSMLPPVERFFRNFGGRQTPYLAVSRATPAARAALAVRAAAQELSRRRPLVRRPPTSAGDRS